VIQQTAYYGVLVHIWPLSGSVGVVAMASVPDAKELEGRKQNESDPAPQSRDFFWDSITLYIVGTILALTAIDVVSEFLRGSDIKCYQPNETDSSLFSSVESYVNEFCSGYLPPLQFLPSVIAIHAIAILAPHFVWLNAYGADLDFFFRHVWKLERNRQQDTGDYSPSNYIISQQIEEAFCKYGRSNGMYWWYIHLQNTPSTVPLSSGHFPRHPCHIQTG
jgi:hypothetical protein